MMLEKKQGLKVKDVGIFNKDLLENDLGDME